MLPVLDAFVRPSIGKNPSKRDRKLGLIPAVIYDTGEKNVHLHEEQISWLLKNYGNNALAQLKIEDKTITALVKEVQRHPINNQILHVDFKPVNSNEKISTKVPINYVNEEYLKKQGGILQTQKNEVEVSCNANSIPRNLNVDISKHNIGTSLRVKDIEVSKEISIIDNPNDIIAAISFLYKDIV